MTGDAEPHSPVLLDEVLAALAVESNGIYVDATFGRGGHSAAILECLGEAGRLVAIDRDAEAVAWAESRFGKDPRFAIAHASFSELTWVANEHGIQGKVDGVLIDLGVSSPQLDQSERGFSFLHDGPLDMRMDQRQSQSAAHWIASAPETEISDVLHAFGEERHARRIARAIVSARQQAPITTTGRLAGIVAAANPSWEKGKHPATRAFQAIRIHINGELKAIDDVLPQVVDVLHPGGRVAVITFHSLEDRRVKRFFRNAASGDRYPKGLPIPAAALKPNLRLLGKARVPSAAEISTNPRARSARLRVAERVA